jgi:hypothetical protein
LQDSYHYDSPDNVTQRSQYWDAGGFSETFDYDELNRLKSSQVNGQSQQLFGYDAAGNLSSKTDVGSYTYPTQGAGAVRPHAVQSAGSLSGFSYDDNGNQTSGAGRTLT